MFCFLLFGSYYIGSYLDLYILLGWCYMFIWVKLGILFLYVAIVYTNCHRTLLLGLRAEKGRCSVTQFRLQAFVCVRAVLLATVEYSTGQCTCPSRVHIKEAVCLVAPCPSVVLCYPIVIFPRSYYVLHHMVIPWVNDIRHMSYSIWCHCKRTLHTLVFDKIYKQKREAVLY